MFKPFSTPFPKLQKNMPAARHPKLCQTPLLFFDASEQKENCVMCVEGGGKGHMATV